MTFVKYNLKRLHKYPAYLITGFILPIVLVVFYWQFISGDYLKTHFLDIIIISVCATTILQTSVNFCSDRIEKRLKHYAIIKNAMKQYLLGEFILNFTYVFLAFIINCFIIGFGAKANIDFIFIFSSLLFTVFIFAISFIISFLIGSLFNTNSSCVFASLVIYYFILSTSNNYLPIRIFYEYYPVLNFLNPIGLLNYLFVYINSPSDLINGNNLTIMLIAVFAQLMWTGFILFLAKNFVKLY